MTEAMKKLQDRIGVGADGHFGKNTAKAIAQHFELSNGMRGVSKYFGGKK